VLAVVVLLGVVAALVAIMGGTKRITGQPVPMAAGGAGSTTSSTSSAPPGSTTAPAGQQAGWTTLRNPTSQLSYQIPPSNWTTQTDDGSVGPVTLSQGARRSAYTCGTPAQEYLRGELGSGVAPVADPAQVATALAYTAASQYYATSGTGPQVAVGAAQPVQRTTPSGKTISGAIVQATATQTSAPCLASKGEVLVLVLRLANQDAVLLVNGDLTGGPASPAPATQDELQKILASATPITG
jgi:hypothetical protein